MEDWDRCTSGIDCWLFHSSCTVRWLKQKIVFVAEIAESNESSVLATFDGVTFREAVILIQKFQVHPERASEPFPFEGSIQHLKIITDTDKMPWRADRLALDNCRHYISSQELAGNEERGYSSSLDQVQPIFANRGKKEVMDLTKRISQLSKKIEKVQASYLRVHLESWSKVGDNNI